MNQYELSRLFDTLDQVLAGGGTRNPLRANDFMLMSITEKGICTFQHINTGKRIKFCTKTKTFTK